MPHVSLNDAQRIAVESTSRDILVLAGAGSGKTKTLVARAERLLRSGIRPERLLLLTFTKKAGEEMRTRLHASIGETASKIRIGTFHSWASRWIRESPKAFTSGSFKIAKSGDAEDLMDIAREAVIDTAVTGLQRALKGGQQLITSAHGEKKADKADVIDRISQLEELPDSATLIEWYSYFRNTSPTSGLFADFVLDRHHVKTEFQSDVLQGVAERYETEKRAQGYLDYDDLLVHFLIAIATDDAPLRRVVKSSYDHVLVDEMQDTSPLQWRLLEVVRNPAHLFCVGDDAQSIYRFRGADYRNVHHFKDRIGNADVLKLTDNYRSTQEILDISNWILDQSEVPYNKRLRAVRGPGEKPRLMSFTNNYDEAAIVADEIQELHADGLPLKSIMAMARRSFDLRSLETEVLKRKIPYILIGGKSLLEGRHVRDLLSLVLAANNHRDKLAWRRFLQLLEGVGKKTATLAADQLALAPTSAAALRLLETHKNPDLHRAAPMVREIQFRSRPADAIKEARRILTPILKENYEEEYKQRVKDFALIEDLASSHASLLGFLDSYTLETVTASQASKKTEDHLTLITCHSAKGTEYSRVYLMCAGPGRFPDNKAHDNEEVEEERRILYVALTRAKDFLTISTSTNESYEWFLEDLPSDMVLFA